MAFDYEETQQTILELIDEYGFAVTIKHMPSTTQDSGVKATPIREEEVIEDGRVIERLMTTMIAATDAALTSEPKAGDFLILGSRQWRIVPGKTRNLVTDAGNLFYKLWLRSA